MVGAWGPRDGDASSEEEEEEEDESPSPTRSREVVLPSAADVVASALEEQAANAQRQAERDAAAELQRLETIRVAREAAAASRKRLTRRHIQLTAVVNNYYQKYKIRHAQRTAEGLAAAPRDVHAAFVELQQVDADLRACEVA